VKRLSAMWTRLRHNRGFAKHVAVVTAMAVIGSGAAIFCINRSRGQWPWQERVSYQADFEAAPAVKPGSYQEVRTAGVVVGQIKKAEVTREGRARLTLSLQPRYAKLYDNASVHLRPKSALNDMYVALSPGGPPGRRLPPGSVIPLAQTRRPIQADEVLGHLDDRARQAVGTILSELDAALADPRSVPTVLRSGAQTLTALRPVAEALESRQQRIARLVSALADIATAAGENDGRLAGLLADARSSLQALSAHDADLDGTLAELPGTTDALRGASRQLQALTTELNPALDGLRGAATQLPDALESVRGVIQRLDGTVTRASPVVAAARPLARDLRPVVVGVRSALADTAAWTPRLDPLTANLVQYLPSVQQAVYQAASVTSLQDGSGPWFRSVEVVGSDTMKPGEGSADDGSGPPPPASRKATSGTTSREDRRP
jgi:phospholipid/cholesterol/gamma-HCH transport system substrate-binding protein